MKIETPEFVNKFTFISSYHNTVTENQPLRGRKKPQIAREMHKNTKKRKGWIEFEYLERA